MQSLTSRSQMRPDRRLGHAKMIRDRARRLVEQVVQRRRRPLLRWQAGQQAGRVGRSSTERHIELPVVAKQPRQSVALPSLPPVLVAYAIEGHVPEPARRILQAEYPLTVAVRLHERVLHRVGRGLSLPGHECEGLHERYELAAEQHLEGITLDRPDPPHSSHHD